MHKHHLQFRLFVAGLFVFSGLFTASACEKSNNPNQTVEKLYELVTFEKGTLPNWDAVKLLFLEEAVIVLRNTRTSTRQLTLDGFIDDFKTFISEARVIETGFSETIIKKHAIVFGDIACYLVLYEAKIPGTTRKNLGVDHFSMIKKNGEWKIVSITNEIPSEECPIPEVLTN